MGRNPARSKVSIHRLNAAEERVLASFRAGRLPAGQVQAELIRARTAQTPAVAPAVTAAPAAQPVPAVAA
jgi:hypothetical protein